ncbi:MAG TPA: Fic family protein [Gemmatimonadaceae bacterium]|nr:Fic family protein [Gemmatimonadaceae bacterium]
MPLADLEPLLPDFASLQAPARAVIARAQDVGRHLHPATLDAITELLRTINCYYSNLIEGHDTHPVDIERALAGELSRDPRTRDLQIEARAHIEVQRLIEARLATEPGLNVCSAEFLKWVHRAFYERLPDAYRIVRNPAATREERVVPGELRRYDVRVGDHIAPSHLELDELLARFAEAYEPATMLREDRGDRALAALGAAHHRLLWIHPFGDGNGRVTRLMTDAYLRRIGVGAHGLWTVSRGLARTRDRYKEMLANADQRRWNDYDGRGERSARALDQFCAFFLEICADQVAYMSTLLAVDRLRDRFSAYCRARASGMLAAPGAEHLPLRPRRGRPPTAFRAEATRLLLTLFAQGPVRREDVEEIAGLADRTARRMVSSLLGEGLIASASQRAPLVLRFPAHVAPYVFPGLYGDPVL